MSVILDDLALLHCGRRWGVRRAPSAQPTASLEMVQRIPKLQRGSAAFAVGAGISAAAVGASTNSAAGGSANALSHFNYNAVVPSLGRFPTLTSGVPLWEGRSLFDSQIAVEGPAPPHESATPGGVVDFFRACAFNGVTREEYVTLSNPLLKPPIEKAVPKGLLAAQLGELEDFDFKIYCAPQDPQPSSETAAFRNSKKSKVVVLINPVFPDPRDVVPERVVLRQWAATYRAIRALQAEARQQKVHVRLLPVLMIDQWAEGYFYKSKRWIPCLSFFL